MIENAFTKANARYMYDADRIPHTITAIQDIYSGKEIFCEICDCGAKYQLGETLAGTHATLAGQRPPPKWHR